jgi:hypothetical protein
MFLPLCFCNDIRIFDTFRLYLFLLLTADCGDFLERLFVLFNGIAEDSRMFATC